VVHDLEPKLIYSQLPTFSPAQRCMVPYIRKTTTLCLIAKLRFIPPLTKSTHDYITSCNSLVLLKMGKIIAQNTLS